MYRSKLLIALVLIVLGPVSLFSAEQVLEPGSLIRITVLEHGELSGAYTVGENGFIDYPLMASVPVDGLTMTQFNALLSPLLSRYVERPIFFVNISRERIIQVQVLGQVNEPGLVLMPSNVHPGLLFSYAGGFSETANFDEVIVFRKDAGGDYSMIRLEKNDFLFLDDELTDFAYEYGDIVVVGYLDGDQSVRVFGQVNKPGFYQINEQENLLDFIYRAGGFSGASDITNVIVYSKRDNMYFRDVYNFKKIYKKASFDELPIIVEGDIVYVPTIPSWKTLETWTRFLQIITASITIYLFLKEQ